ncbi:MAG: ABC transporter substrate-binding protein [Methanophagales archaeon]|nr:ABC transporter substrate-binding protein [Methanophagales archaeon]
MKQTRIRKGAAFGIIAVMVSAMLLASMPTVSAKLYGDANGDGKIDMRDVTYVGLIILGKKPANELADANQDGRVNVGDITYIELVILGKAPHPGKTLKIALGAEPDDLNPLTMYSHSPSDVPKFFNGLVKFDEDLDLAPDLAESWDVSAGGKVYTFHLRQGVKWHDGKEFTAEDVKFTYDLIRSGGIISIFPLATEYEDIEEVDIEDDYTVKFTLREGIVPFRERFTVAILPKHLLEGEDLTTTDFWQHPIGTGPYKFKEWIGGEKLVMVANRNYFAGVPVINEVTFVFVPEEISRVRLLKDGEVDAIKVDARALSMLAGEPGIEIYTAPAANWYGITLPTKTRPFDEKKVRQAIAYAINKQAILDTIFQDKGEIAYGPFRKSSWVYNPDIEYDYNPDKARQLLAQAGFFDTDGDGIVEKDGEKLEFTLIYPVADTERRDIAIAVKTDLAAVGINAKLSGLSWDEITTDLIHENAFTISWGSPYDPDLLNYKLWHSKFLYQGWWNPACYENPAVDELLDKGRTTWDREERKHIYQELQEILVEDQPIAFIVYSDYVYAVSEKIIGITPRPGPHGAGTLGGMTGELWWNMEEWEVKL